MNVSSKTIILQMVKEISKAKDTWHDDDQMMQRIAKIKVLCDVLLDEYEQTQHRQDLTAGATILPTEKVETTSFDKQTEHDDGTSIFDF